MTAPIAGILATLIAWGAAADLWGERRVLTLGLAAAGTAELAAAAVADPVSRWIALFLVGASSSAVHAASGRLILGWFGAGERGLAMGIRQTGLPLGIGVAAVVLPPLSVAGIGPALLALAGGCLASAVVIALVVRDAGSPSPAAARDAGSPYREPYLWRIHASSALLVIPQYAVAVFAFDYLVTALRWSLAGAGLLVAATQVVGAASRPAVGWWSDRVGSRLGPMRVVAVAIGGAMVSLAALAVLGLPAAVASLALAAIITTTPNGLAFTAVAERAGSPWAGRALGIQNTFQNLAGVVSAPPLAVLIGAVGGGGVGYGLAFAAVAAFPFVAILVIPAGDEAAVA